MNVKALSQSSISFSEISERILEIGKTENTYKVSSPEEVRVDVDYYAEYGLKTLGNIVGFPNEFISDLNKTNPTLARSVIKDRVSRYFTDIGYPFCVREFLGKGCGCVSTSYAYFDDTQALEIISSSPLAERTFAYATITPERLHLRAIDIENPFRLPNDDSNLFFCYFLDNSMVGMSSFRLKFGIYRQICTNGMIIPTDEFVVCKQVHRGNRDIADEFNKSIGFLDVQRALIQDRLIQMASTESKLNEMSEDDQITYLNGKLVTSKRQATEILELYYKVYGGRTEWDLANAISEFAKSVPLEKRLFLETKALGLSSAMRLGLGKPKRGRRT